MHMGEGEGAALCRFEVWNLEAKSKTINTISAERLLFKIQDPITIGDFIFC